MSSFPKSNGVAEILDVINRFTYQVEDTELQQASQEIQKQVQSIAILAQRVQNLQNTFDRTAASEIEKRQRIANLIQRNKNLIDQTTQAMGKQVQENQKLQTAITREIGLINTLDARLKVLREDRAKAFDPKDIQRYNREIEATQKRLTQLTATSKGGVLGGVGSAILQGVGIGTGIGLVTQGIGAIKQFIGEASRLAAEAEGVEAAFERLNKPELLGNLRAATKGTVSDLELMKQAISFNNFGLPLDQLATALEFARLRARDTGQSVDYLVQSIVTGIGRQSPLILDNLGINAKRVSDEFQKTGNFAEAAFKIIQEESAKAGEDIETFAQRQARLNAEIDNFKVKLGDAINEVLVFTGSGIKSGFDALATLLAGGEEEYKRILDHLNEVQDDYEKESVKSLEDYLKDYESANELGRRIIESQATQSYNKLLTEQQKYFNQGLYDLGQYLDNSIQKYREFLDRVVFLGPKKVTFQNFTPGDLLGLTREQLNALKEEGENSLNPLAAGDTKGIAAVNSRIRQINQALERFNAGVKLTKKTVKENKVKIRDLIEQTPEQWAAEADKIAAALAKIRKPFSDTNNNLSGVVDTEPSGPTAATTTDINVLNAQIIEARRQEKERKEQQEKEQETLDERKEAYKDAYSSIVNTAVSSFQQIYEARLRFLDMEFEAQSERVNQARLLAEKGNTEQYDLEVKRLNDLQSERERLAKQQMQLNAAVQASNSAVALTEAIGAVVGAAAKGDPYTIAARIAAAVAALIGGVAAVKTAFQPGFKDGVIDLDGPGDGKSDSIPARLSKGESVITAEATAKNKAILQAINDGAVFSMPHVHNSHNMSYATNMDMGGVIKELRAVKQAVADNKFKQDIFFNEYGVGTLTERAMKQNQRQWS